MTSREVTLVERATIPVWARALLGLLALAGLTLLGLFRPRAPVMPWQPLQPTGVELLREGGTMLLWLLLLFACTRLGWLAISPPRRLERIDRDRPAWLPSPRPARVPRRPASGGELLELFGRAQLGSTEVSAVDVSAASRSDETGEANGCIRLAVLGRQLVGADGRVARERATRGLIAYLAIKRAPATLEELCEALWPGDALEKTRQRLWKATRQARRLLGDALVRERDSYRLDRERVRLDGDELDELRAREDWQPGDLVRAFELTGEEPLVDVEYAWANGERRRLQAIQLELLARCARRRLGEGDGNGALAAAERLIERDALNERGWCLAMEAASLLGNRQAILDRYQQLVDTLDERLGLRPSGEATVLYRRLLAQR